MPRLSEMPSPDALTGLELIPVLQGAGVVGNRGMPVLVYNPAFGGTVLALRRPMVADMASTSDADPGAGNVRWNNADPDLATELYINDADVGTGDLAAAFSSLAVGGLVYLQGGPPAERGNLQKWQVTAKSDESGYTKLEVTLQASAGAFTDEDEIELVVQQPAPSPGVDRNVATTVSSSSGVLTYDAALGDYFKTTLSEDVASLVINNVPTACTLGFWLTQDATPRAFVWPGSFNWGAGNSAPPIPAGAGKELFVIVSTNNAGGMWDASARERA